MTEYTAADFRELIAARIRAERTTISLRWLERLRVLLPVDVGQVFPAEGLLDHIPALIEEIARYIEAPDREAVSANTAVISKAQELGTLRHAQEASVHQLLAEYRLLGGILSSFVEEELERLGITPAATEAVALMGRLHNALSTLLQTTMDTFVTEYTATIASHATTLESFNRMVSHELRQPLGTLMYAVPLLRTAIGETGREKEHHLLDVMDRNIARLVELIERLEILSRLKSPPASAPHVQRIELSALAKEVVYQLREMADSRGVALVVDETLPVVVVDPGRLELVLMNLVSNAIKYSDPEKADRFVRIDGLRSGTGHCTLMISDNGLGIPKESQAAVFDRHVRAHADLDDAFGIRGSGLGLTIVAECIEALGGEIQLQSEPGEGSTFILTLPVAPEPAVESASATSLTALGDQPTPPLATGWRIPLFPFPFSLVPCPVK